MAVFFSTNGTGSPIARLRLAEGQVCSNPSEFDRTKGRNSYVLNRNGYYSGCNSMIGKSYFDPRYNKISSVPEDRLFNDNGVSYVVMNLPNYPHGESYQYSWNLFTNSFNYWNSECSASKGVNMEYVVSQIDKAMEISGIQLRLMVVCIIYLILIIIFEICLGGNNQLPVSDANRDFVVNVDVGRAYLTKEMIATTIKFLVICSVFWLFYS